MLTASLDHFVEQYTKRFPTLTTIHDPAWPSPCEIGDPWHPPGSEPQTRWAPVQRRGEANDFAGLEAALEFEIHADLKTYYGRYWSSNLEATAPDGHVSLLFLWNQDDGQRLIENLIGHAVACRHNRTPFSVFFACTEPDSELYLTVNNSTGAVQLEKPGHPPLRQVSPSLAEFIETLEPAEQSDQPYG